VPLSWSDAFDGKERLLFEPEPCFGDGSHPTTRLASQATEAYCVAHSGCSVLDVGTGNGVLSLVAAMSGAGSTLGLDVDAEAVAAAEENARLNALEARCRFSTADVATLEAEFDLVVANLEPQVQLELIAPLARRVRSGGTLLLTGFLFEQAEWIRRAATSVGLHEVEALRSKVGIATEHDADMARLAQELDPLPCGAELDGAELDEATADSVEYGSDGGGYVLLAWTRPAAASGRGSS
ncbi:MAG TPA: 50S ribosomal protein L11 methyltransferase, partial [Polyangiaceae bacterium]